MSSNPKRLAAKVVQLRQPSVAPSQLPLLPLRADALMPAPGGTADLKHIIRTVDGHYYAAKRVTDHPMLPASEFICYKLAAACNLPVPFASVISLANGEMVFGSRFEGGVIDQAAIGPRAALEAQRQCAGTISAVLSFDLFVGNDDRHPGNFLFRKNYEGEWVPLAIDYSRALFVNNFPNDIFPIGANTHTRTSIKSMKAMAMWNGPFAIYSMELMRTVKRGNLEHWLREMPPEWLSIDARAQLLGWWQSEAFLARLNALFDLL